MGHTTTTARSLAAVTPSQNLPSRKKPIAHVPRYTLAKFKAFAQYRQTASSWRIATVIMLTPLLSLLTTLLPPLVPLKDPHLGYAANFRGYLTHNIVTMWLTTFAAGINVRASAGISHDDYPTRFLFVVALLATVQLVGLILFVGYFWRFPIPFQWALISGPWLLVFSWTHYVVLYRRIQTSESLRRRMVAYLPSFTVQVSQIVMYPAYTAAYHAASEWIKVGLTVLFPILKYFLKRIIRRLSDLTLEATEEVIVTGIKITAAIYQSMIMQSTPSVLVTIVTIGVDLVQGVLEVRHVMEKHSVNPQREIILAGLQFIDQWHPNSQWTDDRLRAYGSRSKSPLFALNPRATMTNLIDKRRVTAAMQQRDKIVLVHALEILQAAEKILLVEYIEVVIPFMNGVFLVVASQLDSAIYNVNIVGFYFHRERLAPALLSLFLYIALQSFSIVLMAFVMRVRFQLSPSVLLAFHLERHANATPRVVDPGQNGGMALMLASVLGHALRRRLLVSLRLPHADRARYVTLSTTNRNQLTE